MCSSAKGDDEGRPDGTGGLIKTIAPVHTTFDGDLIFAVSLGEMEGDINRIGVLGEFCGGRGHQKGRLKKADGFGKLPAFRDVSRGSRASLYHRKPVKSLE